MKAQKYLHPLLALFVVIISASSINAMANDAHKESADHEEEAIIRNYALHDLGLYQFLKKAEEYTGGIAVDIEIEDNENNEVAEITLVRNDELIEVTCSLSTGEVLSSDSSGIINNTMMLLNNEYKWIKNSKVSLAEATKIAEKNEGGIAYHACIEEESGVIFYSVKMLANGKMTQLRIDREQGIVKDRRVLITSDDED